MFYPILCNDLKCIHHSSWKNSHEKMNFINQGWQSNISQNKLTHENSAVQQITNNNLVVIALDSLSVTKLKEMTSYLKGAYV